MTQVLTTPRLGVDYAYAPTDPARFMEEAKRAGVSWLFRYACNSPDRGLNSKKMTLREANAARGAGLDVVWNWQLGKDSGTSKSADWRTGRNGGYAMAQQSMDAITAAGYTDADRRLVVHSVDQHHDTVDWNLAYDHFHGICEARGSASLVGAYGSAVTIENLASRGLVNRRLCVQTASWSGFLRDSSGWPVRGTWLDVAMRQVTVDSVSRFLIAGTSCDRDLAVHEDFGQRPQGPSVMQEVLTQLVGE